MEKIIIKYGTEDASLEELANKVINEINEFFGKKKENKEPPKDIHYYIHKVAGKLGVGFNECTDILSALPDSAQISTLLNTIAIELDKRYPDHIKNCEKLYVISTISGKVVEIKKPYRLNNYAAFRTVEDAKFARSILIEAGFGLNE